jgi:lysozyme family protein
MGIFSRIKNAITPYRPIKIIPSDYVFKINDNFDFAFKYVLKNEGGLDDHPLDRGGITKYGVILDDLKDLGFDKANAKNIQELTIDDAKYIYKTKYWDALNLNSVVNKGVACALFDISVVRGIGIPPKYCFQMYGTKDLKYINSREPNEFIKKFKTLCDLGFNQIVEKNPTQKVFLEGWLNRSDRLLTLIGL